MTFSTPYSMIMNLSRCVLAVFASLLFFALPVPGHAGKPKTPPAPPDVRKVIQKIDSAEQSITIINHRDHNSTHSYKIDFLTKIFFNFVPGKFDQIKVGMVVTDMTERDSSVLDSITLTGTGEEPKAATPAKPKKK